ncbi:CDC27 family protein [Priestia aryabhattai]|uniref:tetratricopeptide repeat protein n=1 Tax=Priestia aryabhattai TaxID=412384 RepID=UPI003D2C1C42
MIESIAKGLATPFFSFILPRLKNQKKIRDFRDKWLKDDYALNLTLMFKAAIDDAKAIIDIPNEVIKEILDDKVIREELFRLLVKDTSDETIFQDDSPLHPYYEKYPEYREDFFSFFQLFLLTADEYKKKNWSPEFQLILNDIELLKKDLQRGFKRLEKQTEGAMSQVQQQFQTIVDILDPIEFKDLQKLLLDEKVNTVCQLAKERLKQARTLDEKLELNLIIANSYLQLGRDDEAVSYLHAALSCSESESRKINFKIQIKIIEKQFDEALSLIKKNIENDGYTKRNVEFLVHVHSGQGNYQKCLSILDEHSQFDLPMLKIRTLLMLKHYAEAVKKVDELLEKNPTSSEAILIKAEILVMEMEDSLKIGKTISPEKILEEVKPLLFKLEQYSENTRLCCRSKELKAILYYRDGQFGKAAHHYKEIYDISDYDKKDFYFKSLVWSYYLSKDQESAILLLQEKLKVQKDHMEYIIMLARMHMELGNPKESLQLLKRFKITTNHRVEFPIDYYTVIIQSLYLVLDYEAILSFINKVKQECSVDLGHFVQGFYYGLLHDWDKCILYLKEIKLPEMDEVHSDFALKTKIQLINAYYSRATKEDYIMLKHLVPTIPHWKFEESFVNNYVHALYELMEYEEILNFYYNENISNLMIKQLIASIYFENKWFRLAKSFYEEIYQETRDVKSLFHYATCLFHLGETKKCFETLKLAENKINKNPSTNELHLLAMAYIDVMDYENGLMYAYKTFKYGENSPVVWRNYFGIFTQLTQHVEPKEVYVEAYHKIWRTFHETFPEEEVLFKEFQAIEGDELSKEFLNQLETLENSNAVIDSVLQSNKFSSVIFCQMFNKEPFQTWGYIVTNKNLHFLVSQVGSKEEENQGIKIVLNSKRVLCDLFSLFTLNKLGVLEKSKQYFQIYIYQDHFTLLYHEYSQMKLSLKQGIKNISYKDGKIIGQEITPKDIKETCELLEGLINWINRNCIKVGRGNIKFQEKVNEDLDFINDPISLCKSSAFTMMVDTLSVKDYAEKEYQVETFSSLDFINGLMVKKKINIEDYYEYIGQLIIMGYTYITAPVEVFAFWLEKHKFVIEQEVEWLFSYLKTEEINEGYASLIVLKLVIWVWKRKIELNKKKNITHYLCGLINHKNQSINFLKEFFRNRKNVLNLSNSEYEMLENSINMYLK